MQPAVSKWIRYNLVVCFAVYWLSNLLLWYPWSVNESLGQVLMLTVNPLLWGFASYSCVIRCPQKKLITAVIINSIVFTIEAIASDFVFFVLIRHAKDKLMHVTTFYAWGFVFCLPFIIYLLFRNRMAKNRQDLTSANFRKPLLIGILSFVAVTLIIVLNIQF